MKTNYQAISVQTGDNTTVAAREQLCGHVFPPTMTERAVMKAVFRTVRARPIKQELLVKTRGGWFEYLHRSPESRKR
jgi:hypothetical protein